MVQRVPERPAGINFDPALLSVLQQDGYAINRLLDAFKSGTWTPTVTFATPGDLTVAYSLQEGHYWRVGAMCLIAFRLDFTPTFTTASGGLRIEGLPFAILDSRDIGVPLMHGANMPYPAGVSTLMARFRNASSYMTIDGSGSGLATTDLIASDFTSGQAQTAVAGGVYQADVEHP